MATQTAWADEVRVAVAANFATPVQVLATDFERATAHKVVVSIGSTGKLSAQIRNGARYEVRGGARISRLAAAATRHRNDPVFRLRGAW